MATLCLLIKKNERLKVIKPIDNKRRYKFDSWPWNIAVSCLNEMELYVTLPDLRQIVLININVHFEKTNTITTDADCWGVVSSKEGLFVSLWNENYGSREGTFRSSILHSFAPIIFT